MRQILFTLLCSSVVMMTACGGGDVQNGTETTISTYQNDPGDSAHYGLACDGSTDSVLVLLPYDCQKLDTFDIIDAFQQHRIYGRPHIGDAVAVIVNPNDPEEALSVYNLEELKGEWCYMVEPTLRNVENMPQRLQRRMISDMQKLPDSLRKLWLTPREYSMKIKRDNSVNVHGSGFRQTSSDDMSPVEFPPVKRYTDWKLYNGKLILKADTISGFTKEGDKPQTDTATILLLFEDSLVLQFNDHQQAYYRKKATPEKPNPTLTPIL